MQKNTADPKGWAFTKMQGLGNDFMVIDGVRQAVKLTSADLALLSRRDLGVGFDQCLLVEKSADPKIDFFYRIFNADGQEVGQCGNGARCLARFLQYTGLTQKNCISVATKTTQMELQINPDESVTIKMPPPLFAPAQVPILFPSQQKTYMLPLADKTTVQVHALNVGNPHAVSVVNNLTEAPVENLGKALSLHPLFPEQSNAGFMEIIDSEHLRLRVYERGCGETQACGSGAIAAAVVGRLFYHMAAKIEVTLLGGELFVEWEGEGQPIFLTGPAGFVYEGRILV